jgi:rhomboid family GlyGly-CTERM serine protease
MLNLPTKKEYITGPLLVAGAALLLFIFQASVNEILIFDRRYIGEMQAWRLFTGNYLHSNLNHLLLNLGGLLLLWSLHGDHFNTKRYLFAFIFFCLSVSLCLYLFTPGLNRYVGLSGALHGVFVWGAIKDIKVGYKTGWGLLIGVAIKIAYEQLVGPSESLAETIGAIVAVDAHLFGALMGLIWAITEHFMPNTSRTES